jgi:hypothetical protein
MTDFDALKRRSAELKFTATEKALTVHRTIFEQEPSYEPAANRLGITLYNMERLDEAQAVFEAAIEASPGNAIAVRRLYEVKRRIANPPEPPKPPAQPKAPPGPSYWIKAIPGGGNGWTMSPGNDDWISDIGQRDEEGERVYTQDGTPANKPSWKPGDQVGLYFDETRKVPVLVEIMARPEFAPEIVAQRAGSPDAGDRAPWVTKVRCILAVELEDAPTLADLGLQDSNAIRRSRFGIDAETHARLRAALQ